MMKMVRVFVFGLLCCLSPVVNAADEITTFLQNGITAHRGNSEGFPENTIPAFRSAMELGSDWIELDIFRTADGEIVVTHDATTGRVADRNLTVARSTYAELQTLDVATDHRRRLKLSLSECPVERMPKLVDVLKLVVSQRLTRVSIQPKADCVAEAMQISRSLKAESWVGFNDGNLAYMKQVKKLAPEIPVFWDRGSQTDLADDIRVAKECGFESLVLREDGVTPEKIQQIQAAGLKAGAWTVNNAMQMKTLLAAGIDRIYTDRPGIALKLKSAASPAAR